MTNFQATKFTPDHELARPIRHRMDESNPTAALAPGPVAEVEAEKEVRRLTCNAVCQDAAIKCQPAWNSMTWCERLAHLESAVDMAALEAQANAAGVEAASRAAVGTSPSAAADGASPPEQSCRNAFLEALSGEALPEPEVEVDPPPYPGARVEEQLALVQHPDGMSAGYSAKEGSLDCCTDFPAADLRELCGYNWCFNISSFLAIVIFILIVVLTPFSIGKVSSEQAALGYDNFNSILRTTILTEGLQIKPTFGSLIKWPITNQMIDLHLQCNSRDAIAIDLVVDFLYIPITASIYQLSLDFHDFEGYMKVVESVAGASIRNACGDWDARAFQTMRGAVADGMEDAVRADLSETMRTTVLQLNLRNIDYAGDSYERAVDVSQVASADIELAMKQEEQQLIKANTVLKEAEVNKEKTIDNARSEANIIVATAVEEIKGSAFADVKLAKQEREQLLIAVETQFKIARIEANKTLAKAIAEAAAITATAEMRYRTVKDRYSKFADLLKFASTTVLARNGTLSSQGILTYLSNAVVGGGGKQQQVALDAPALFSWKSEL
jgi:hypothetical protein